MRVVLAKIVNPSADVGIVNGNAYGTIAELGYACKCKDVAVYVLPDNKVDSDELQDLWFLFQIIKDTKHLWSDEDIKNIEEFAEFNIFSLKDYECFLDTVIHNFMK